MNISGLLDVNPIICEPGQHYKIDSKPAIDYSIAARYLVLCTVCQMLDRKTEFDDDIHKFFILNFEKYLESIKVLEPHHKKHICTMHHNVIIDCDKIKANLISQKNKISK